MVKGRLLFKSEVNNPTSAKGRQKWAPAKSSSAGAKENRLLAEKLEAAREIWAALGSFASLKMTLLGEAEVRGLSPPVSGLGTWQLAPLRPQARVIQYTRQRSRAACIFPTDI